ncbi:Os11g0702000, partial [Oryza sativa Japonica Group]
EVSVPEHDAAVVGRPPHQRQRVEHQRRRVDPPVARRVPRRRQPDVDARVRVPRRPPQPRPVERPPLRRVVRAPPVVVEPHVDPPDQTRRHRRLAARLLPVHAPHRRRQQHAAVFAEALGQLVVVGRPAVVDVEVDAVDHGVAEGAEHAMAAAAEVGVPEVVGDVLGRPGRREGVLVAVAADGEEHGDVLGVLAVLDVGADAGDGVAGEVGPVAAVAEDGEEGDDDGVVDAGVAGLPERALVLVPAPEDGELAGLVAGDRPGAGEDEEHYNNK